MGKIILYHGTPDRVVVPKYGGGDEKHDYGKGFYLLLFTKRFLLISFNIMSVFLFCKEIYDSFFFADDFFPEYLLFTSNTVN